MSNRVPGQEAADALILAELSKWIRRRPQDFAGGAKLLDERFAYEKFRESFEKAAAESAREKGLCAPATRPPRLLPDQRFLRAIYAATRRGSDEALHLHADGAIENAQAICLLGWLLHDVDATTYSGLDFEFKRIPWLSWNLVQGAGTDWSVAPGQVGEGDYAGRRTYRDELRRDLYPLMPRVVAAKARIELARTVLEASQPVAGISNTSLRDTPLVGIPQAERGASAACPMPVAEGSRTSEPLALENVATPGEVQIDPEAKLGVADLARRFGVPVEALRKGLERWRGCHVGDRGFVSTEDRGRGMPRYLYSPVVAAPIARKLRAKASVKTSVIRPSEENAKL